MLHQVFKVRNHHDGVARRDAEKSDEADQRPDGKRPFPFAQIVGQENRQNAANQRFQAYRAEWVQQYREAISPVVREIAGQRKMSIIVNKTDPILYFDGAVDVTNAVVDAARAKPPALHPVAVPTLGVPSNLQMPNVTTQPATPTTQSSKG